MKNFLDMTAMLVAKAVTPAAVLSASMLLGLAAGHAQNTEPVELITQSEANYPPADEIRGPVPVDFPT